MRVLFDGKSYPLAELERELGFRFLPQIGFRSPEEREEILQRGLQKPDVKPLELEQGARFRREIEASTLPNVSIRSVSEKVGYGLFAEERIKPGAYVGEYTGIVHRNNNRYLEPLNDYCYKYPVDDHLGIPYVINARQGHLTRFINHSEKPNLKPTYAYCDGLYHLIFLAISEISPGDQLFYHYGANYWSLRSRPEPI